MSRQLPTPSPSPPRSVATPTLPAEINAATRKQHIKLNRLIVDRLPIALPPNQPDPRLIGEGLAAFACIYYTFEAVWDELASSGSDDIDLERTHDDHVRQWLLDLRVNGLARAQRFKDDMSHIALRTGQWPPAEFAGQQQMLADILRNVTAKPHVLIAYSWVMYMAIFSGGRWIRQQLSNAGVEFWTGTLDCPQVEKNNISLLELPGFSFLSFDGEQDGEDMKALFKARLAEAETLLTYQERQDVVLAARELFNDCIALVEMLDREVWWQRLWSRMPSTLLSTLGVLVVFLWCHAKFGYMQ